MHICTAIDTCKTSFKFWHVDCLSMERSLTGGPMSLLRIDDLHLSFGGVKAINGVSTGVEKGTIHAIIGPNGAGKTSIFNCISCVYRPQRGSVFFEDRKLTGTRPDRVVHLGIARTFQN